MPEPDLTLVPVATYGAVLESVHATATRTADILGALEVRQIPLDLTTLGALEVIVQNLSAAVGDYDD